VVKARLDAIDTSGDKKERQRHARTYNAFLLDGAVTIAHELVHCFVGFLSGDRTILTPTQIAPPGYITRSTVWCGESGEEWEFRVLGGQAELSAPSSEDRFPEAQNWVKRNNKELRVDPKCITGIVENKGKLV